MQSKRLRLEPESKIFVACPAHVATGGPELLHQLVYELNNLKMNAYMYYYHIKEESPVHEAYVEYNNPFVTSIEDSPKNVLIVPEVPEAINLLPQYTCVIKILWWLSVDNYFDWFQYMRKKRYFLLQKITNKIFSKTVFDIEELSYQKFLKSKKRLSVDMIESIDFHFYQSHYAKEMLEMNGIQNKFYLSDYLNENFLIHSDRSIKKENIIAYNPKKGQFFTNILIASSPQLCFVPIIDMSREEVISLLEKSKVYIDFGNHPGKDRIPREAAMLGCCIITNKQGSARFSDDVPIPEDYKFDMVKSSVTEIIDKIKYCLNDYGEAIKDFEDYRKVIKNEYKEFKKSIENIFILGNDE